MNSRLEIFLWPLRPSKRSSFQAFWGQAHSYSCFYKILKNTSKGLSELNLKDTRKANWNISLQTRNQKHKPTKKKKEASEIKGGRSGNQSSSHFFSSASRVPAPELPAPHGDHSRLTMSETPICLDTLSCDSIGLRNTAPLMDKLGVCLSTLKACDLHTVKYWQHHYKISITRQLTSCWGITRSLPPHASSEGEAVCCRRGRLK